MVSLPYTRVTWRTPVDTVAERIPFMYLQILQHAEMLARQKMAFTVNDDYMSEAHIKMMETLRSWKCLAWKLDRSRRAIIPREYVVTFRGRRVLDAAKARILPNYQRKFT